MKLGKALATGVAEEREQGRERGARAALADSPVRAVEVPEESQGTVVEEVPAAR
ncbi:hypothetical protein ABZ858_02985 [Streptomyces sp. NPDC047017]|uniref:hypothetical protein n=1 Tax=Streptomyces sp. NPDC047017 TaxID=3155024 RepID=UPI003410A2A0